MNFVADLHIHSRFSMATSKAITVPHLAAWAINKGIDVLGSGDFTHPKWRAELEENLAFDEASGLYRLKGKPEALQFMGGRHVAPHYEGGPFFCPQTEISSIYKRGGKTRKVHNLVFMPNFEAAEKFSKRLALIGNINSDGRPILGLDSHDLLEIVLECSDDARLVPAHIWTPWFSLFGSKSGFDQIEDCYGDLTPHIFALETGLSSDPAMNRHLSALDGYALISNSDAHSGPNLGREANLFSGAPSYLGMFDALRRAARHEQGDKDRRFIGTLEFYPEEGKYHLDGHRACGMVVDPSTMRDAPEICQVCGKPLTIGVLRRVMELADRREPGKVLAEAETRMLVPLPEVIGEILGASPSSRKVMDHYADLLAGLGSELDILCRMPEKVVRERWEPLGEAVARMRAGQVHIQPGFDGQYGVIRVFDEQESAEIRADSRKKYFLPGISHRTERKAAPARKKDIPPVDGRKKTPPEKNTAFKYSPEQFEAILAETPAFISAGPGSGKTRVLVARILHLLEQGTPPSRILALAFTRRAAEEMRERLKNGRGNLPLPQCDTLHGLAWELLREKEGSENLAILNDTLARRLFISANSHLAPREARELWNELALAREKNLEPDSRLRQALLLYAGMKNAGPRRYLDYADLQEWLLGHGGEYTGRWEHILVDEAQDLSPVQLEILKKILPARGDGFFGIGDPDQAIYGFRGASGQSESEFRAIWPGLRVFRLGKSYRSSQKVLDMAQNVLCHRGKCGELKASASLEADLRLFAARDEKTETEWIAAKIKELLGSTAHTLLDASHADSILSGIMSPGDIAVLARLKTQIQPIARALENAGIPFSAPAEMEFWEDELCASFLDNARQLEPASAPEDFIHRLVEADIDAKLLQKSPQFAELCRVWHECGDWKKFFDRLAWLHEAELISQKAQSVRLLTLHASKGLEFQAVFIPGLENGLLPLDRAFLYGKECGEKAQDLLESERRLFYVGLTRAARGVFLSYCHSRRLYGKRLELAPSPFLDPLRAFCRQSRLARHSQRAEHALSLFPTDSGR